MRLPLRLEGDASRTIALPFGVWNEARTRDVFAQIEQLTDDQVARELERIRMQFTPRHANLEALFEEHYRMAAETAGHSNPLPRERRLLVGAYFTMEYSFQSAALFNPSIVPHPDQSSAPPGGLRFLMSLRAVGEGHVSSVVFASGAITARHKLRLDPFGSLSARVRPDPDREYLKPLFARKLREIHADGEPVELILAGLPERFTLGQFEARVEALRPIHGSPAFEEAVQSARWLARSNYSVELPRGQRIEEFVLFPNSANESRGIEDMRMVRFVDDDDSVTYYGTYSAFNGQFVLPMLMETHDFRRLQMHTLNGAAAKNKGFALFPRRVNGHYCMCGRIDGRRLFIMYSDHVHFWESATPLAEPRFPWELQLIGNCGSPIETPEGWLLLTHGVGPMRRYCIGAMLLDLNDPLRIIGRLREPLLSPTDVEREGYVPNVVYSCGGLVFRDRLYLPYAMSDEATSFAVIPVDPLLDELKRCGP
ncbi:MAG: glycosidase [Planctomycetota bacterium]|nr:MAG: glycosidase [Planctomycetota bacterium]